MPLDRRATMCACRKWFWDGLNGEWQTRLASGPYRGSQTWKKRVTCHECKTRMFPDGTTKPPMQTTDEDEEARAGQLKMEV